MRRQYASHSVYIIVSMPLRTFGGIVAANLWDLQFSAGNCDHDMNDDDNGDDNDEDISQHPSHHPVSLPYTRT